MHSKSHFSLQGARTSHEAKWPLFDLAKPWNRSRRCSSTFWPAKINFRSKSSPGTGFWVKSEKQHSKPHFWSRRLARELPAGAWPGAPKRRFRHFFHRLRWKCSSWASFGWKIDLGRSHRLKLHSRAAKSRFNFKNGDFCLKMTKTP